MNLTNWLRIEVGNCIFRLLGHTTLRMSYRYMQETEETRGRAIDALNKVNSANKGK
jgi:hypothetical protein